VGKKKRGGEGRPSGTYTIEKDTAGTEYGGKKQVIKERDASLARRKHRERSLAIGWEKGGGRAEPSLMS